MKSSENLSWKSLIYKNCPAQDWSNEWDLTIVKVIFLDAFGDSEVFWGALLVFSIISRQGSVKLVCSNKLCLQNRIAGGSAMGGSWKRPADYCPRCCSRCGPLCILVWCLSLWHLKYFQPTQVFQPSEPFVITEMWGKLFHKMRLLVNLQTLQILS